MIGFGCTRSHDTQWAGKNLDANSGENIVHGLTDREVGDAS